ncbi:MAG: alanine--tRNA ligase [Clostridia bacterium]|nr:alanine--tRNA ligase [Clostridia bacterium]MDD4387460.1 alanine--tRNA ligase [Clostridia bacterium]
MKAIEIRNKYLDFFKSKGHKIISGAKLIPENDPTVLFTTAGMHPLVPYLIGSPHPEGKRIVDFQKCLRTDDIDEVGDNRHLTFFEMLGNWSLGDYFKEDSIKYSFEFLTKVLNIPVDKISVTCFLGDNDAPKDDVSAKIWEECGIDKTRIYFFGKKDNWWGPAGQTGPCGPDTEIFLDTGVIKCSNDCNPSCDCGKYIEIWNNVFMEYNKMEDGSFKQLSQKNVDTGMGLERMAFLMQGKNHIFETELFMPIISKVSDMSENPEEDSLRIIADHLRASAFLICDSVIPSNVGQGYILRRLIRRTIRHMRKIGFNPDKITDVCVTLIDNLNNMYGELETNRNNILEEIKTEKNRFMNTLLSGEKEFIKVINKLKENNINIIDGIATFRLYDTFGFPPEVTNELAKENGLCIDMDGFKVCFEQHQAKSREGSEGIFKGGLADHSEETTKYHTAAHLILESLQKILGNDVIQKGSNITAERIRFDFSHPEKVTRELLDQVEDMVNAQIDKKLQVVCSEMLLDEARKYGAKGIFNSKYGESVKVYTIEGFSKEICGGPHVDNTSKLNHIKILKEEAVSSGIRRIKAVFIK